MFKIVAIISFVQSKVVHYRHALRMYACTLTIRMTTVPKLVDNLASSSLQSWSIERALLTRLV